VPSKALLQVPKAQGLMGAAQGVAVTHLGADDSILSTNPAGQAQRAVTPSAIR